MTQYLILSGTHAMDDIPHEEMPAVADAAHAVCRAAIEAGVFVRTSGLAGEPTMVTPEGDVTEDAYPETIGGVTIVEVSSREEALEWAAKIAAACRCAVQLWEFGFDPEIAAMLREAAERE